ncbi:hypothetical protein B0H16DRAFT_1459837 [Mycena metata]|uniref:P-loop containing nucleoside triphosphate hydrolase protein n=1 Tax=Mycena metata TaxID=1033252 RepID=A0AAD7N9Q1_9AGAR|nr:hypothetical protein B0H16DRAFT_1459837 [Mycena metata]
MPPRVLVLWLQLIDRVGSGSGRSWVISTIRKFATHPQVSELFRFIFLGTIIETGRQVSQWISDFARDFFVVNSRAQYFHRWPDFAPQVKAEFAEGDFAYDWVVNYLENHRVWNESRTFKVVARNAATRPYPTSNLGKIDGHPDPLYEPATTQSPSLFRWKGYWMSIYKSSAGWSHYDSSGYGAVYGGGLVLSVWTRNRHVLDEFVAEAREFYVNSEVLPRKQFDIKTEQSESLLTAHFTQGDLSYDWMLEFFRGSNAFKDIMDLNVTTKQSDLGWGIGPKDSVRYMPAPESMQRLLFTSPRTGKSTWLQVAVTRDMNTWSRQYSTLGRLISDTPSRCILLIEDIDCAFPSREEPDEDEEEKPQRDRNGNPIPRIQMVPSKSAVTLSGLLNVLDSVSSEEGRITFATTNHIENLDPALLRAGRMDLKIKYSLATAVQIEEVFRVFFGVTDDTDRARPSAFIRHTAGDIERLATEFAASMPPDTYSIAQIQGYLLRKKRDPLGAAKDVGEWLEEQEEERRVVAEAKRRWRAERARQRRAEAEYQWVQVGPYQQIMDMPPVEGKVVEAIPPSAEAGTTSISEGSPPDKGTVGQKVATAGEE